METLETAAAKLSALCGSNFLSLSLGGSRAIGLDRPDSDVDYYILFSKETDSSREASDQALRITNDLLSETNFQPCTHSNFHILQIPKKWGSANTSPTTLALFTFITFLIKGDISMIQRITLESYADFRHYLKQGYSHALATSQTAIEELYSIALGLTPERVVEKFLKHQAAFMMTPENHMNILMADERFKEELVNLARPHIERRKENYPFPREILDILAISA